MNTTVDAATVDEVVLNRHESEDKPNPTQLP